MKTALITGATNGIGLYVARNIAAKGFTTIIHGRSQMLLDKVVNEIIAETSNNNVFSIKSDFSNLKNVNDMVLEINKQYSSLNLLINNAGATFTDRTTNDDGHELTLTINYLAPFLLTTNLLPLLRESASTKNHSRVINVSTLGSSDDTDVPNESDVYWQDLQTNERYSLIKAYWRSKVLLNTFTFHLADLEQHNNVNVNAVHPGTIITNMTKNIATLGLIENINDLDEVSYGGERILNLALSQDLETTTGQFFTDRQKDLNNDQPDIDSRKKLWEITNNLLDI